VATKKKPAAKTKTVAKKTARKPLKKKITRAATPAVKAKKPKPKLKKVKVFKKPLPRKPAPKAKLKAGKKAPKGPKGLPEQQRDAALKILDERQATEIVTMDVRGRSAMADYVIVATGRSARQLAAIADYLRAAFAQIGVRKIRVEGLPQGDWVLIDGGDVLVHLFRPEVRRYYSIEDIGNRRHGG